MFSKSWNSNKKQWKGQGSWSHSSWNSKFEKSHIPAWEDDEYWEDPEQQGSDDPDEDESLQFEDHRVSRGKADQGAWLHHNRIKDREDHEKSGRSQGASDAADIQSGSSRKGPGKQQAAGKASIFPPSRGQARNKKKGYDPRTGKWCVGNKHETFYMIQGPHNDGIPEEALKHFSQNSFEEIRGNATKWRAAQKKRDRMCVEIPSSKMCGVFFKEEMLKHVKRLEGLGIKEGEIDMNPLRVVKRHHNVMACRSCSSWWHGSAPVGGLSQRCSLQVE
jgi:hypothetical protein